VEKENCFLFCSFERQRKKEKRREAKSAQTFGYSSRRQQKIFAASF
jgi:hypothetical protein